LGSVEASQ
jgi:hypothetical protein